MQNNEKPALFVNPQLALEVTQNLKANCPEAYKDLLQDAYGVITERDLVFYLLGKSVASKRAIDSFVACYGKRIGQEEGQ